MLLPDAKRTWIVMLQDSGASVFESEDPGGCFTRVNVLAPAAAGVGLESLEPGSDAEIEWLARVARWLDEERPHDRYGRLMIVGAFDRVDRLLACVSADTRALVAAKHVDDLSGVPPEELRWHIPDGANL